MDLLSMLMNARVTHMDGDEIGEVVGINIAMGKLYIMVDTDPNDEEGDGDDPDGGEEIDEDDEHELDKTGEVPKPVPLRAVVGEKK